MDKRTRARLRRHAACIERVAGDLEEVLREEIEDYQQMQRDDVNTDALTDQRQMVAAVEVAAGDARFVVRALRDALRFGVEE